jgi:phosphoribosylamine--glycine ligase
VCDFSDCHESIVGQKSCLHPANKLEAMKILVLGQGAREHAIIKSLIGTGTPAENIVAAPGNAGIAGDVRTVETLNPNSPDEVTRFAKEEAVDLVIVGPEAPLVAGVSDALRAAGIAVFGPSQKAAALEGSKSFAKEVMAAAGVPTGMARECATIEEVETAMAAFGAPYVIKADGLAAGKGVIVTSDRQAALDHARNFIDMGILVEEFLDGQEVSLFFLSDGKTVLPLTPAQDFKRAFDGDAGPNTGGMGAYSPLPWLPDGFVEEVQETVALPTVHELARLGAEFVGLLYCGLIVTARGIRVIEFNARFGDPETQVVLRRLVTPLAGLLHKAATGQLANATEPEFTKDVAITVVLASEGYPTSSAPNRAITGLTAAEQDEHISIAHAATKVEGDELLATGGRVLSVVSLAKSFKKARKHAYEAIEQIHLAGSHYRKDIAKAVADVEEND